MFSHDILSRFPKESDDFYLFSRDLHWMKGVPVLAVSPSEGYLLDKNDIRQAIKGNGKTGIVEYGYLLRLRPDCLTIDRQVQIAFPEFKGEGKLNLASLRKLSEDQEKAEDFIFLLDEED